MARTEINANAPVILGGEIEVAAPPEIVWDVLTTIEGWPRWNPEVKSASLEGELAPGSVFRWKAGPSRLVSRLLSVEPQREIAWTGKSMGINVIHVYGFEPRDGGTLVHTDESVEGVTARLFRGPLKKRMDSSIDLGLRSLKAEAERRAADQRLSDG
jgi:uncharacterized protein YndB with AHSA1/START domain